MKQKIILTVGIPASGKSTYAKELCKDDSNFRRVNKDDIRLMIQNLQYSKKDEDAVVDISRATGMALLSKGFNIIVDDTNLSDKHVNFWKEHADEFKYDFELKIFDTPLDECLKRDASRSASVGREVILNMYKQFKSKYKNNKNYLKDPRCENYDNFSEATKHCIVIDIDGTISLINGRSPYDGKYELDLPNIPVIAIVNSYGAPNSGNKLPVILLTGREEKYREKTIEWLNINKVNFDELIMRPDKDKRHDDIVKKEQYENLIKPKYKVFFVIEDRDRCVKMWRDLNICCLQPFYGDF